METLASQPLSSPLAQPPQNILPGAGLYLQIRLDRSLPVMLPAQQLVEILTVAIAQVVPIFHLPPWVMGVYNWRGEVLWMVDLNHLLGLTPWYEQVDYGSKHTVIVLRGTHQSQEKAIVGLVVSRVEEIVECTADTLHLLSELNSDSDSASDAEASGAEASIAAIDELPAKLHPFLAGYWQTETAPRYWLLNHAVILQHLSETFSETFSEILP